MRVDIGGCKLFFDVEGAKFRPDGTRMLEVTTVLLLHGGPGADHSIFKPAYLQLADKTGFELTQTIKVTRRFR